MQLVLAKKLATGLVASMKPFCERIFVVGVVDRLRDTFQSIVNYTTVMQYPVPCGPVEASA